MKTEILAEIGAFAEAYLPKATCLDKDNPALFFSKHLRKIGDMVKDRENLGNARYELQFDQDVAEDWINVMESTIKKMGYTVSTTVNSYGLAVFILRWQAIGPAD